MENVDIEFLDSALHAIAKKAWNANQVPEVTFHFRHVLLDTMYELPSIKDLDQSSH